MGVLVGGVAGSSSRLSGGLLTTAAKMVGEPQPMSILRAGPSLGVRLGKFRKILYDGVSLPLTKDSTGTPLPACVVKAFATPTDAEVDQAVSDSSAAYEISVYTDAQHYVVAYLAGSPDRAGTTVNTLTGQ